jgi:SAM-dependent methyltransferase
MKSATASGGQYGDVFFASIGEGSAHSANVLVPLILKSLPVESVLDLGTGSGTWLRPFLAAGKNDVLGIDGSYVSTASLVIDPGLFLARDITQPIDLGRRFDLAICLEVGEHVPPETSDVLVDNLTRHSSMVLFSAAVPGQGGVDHINEQPLEFWRGLFGQRKFVAHDPFRPLLRGRTDVEPWYRYNTLLYVREDRLGDLPESIAASKLPATTPVPDVSSPLFRLRKAILSALPRWAVSFMANTKHQLRVVARPRG